MHSSLTLLYLPTAIMLGALHALEPGHAKTLTAAYLIGIKGTRRDAVLLGLSVAATHSLVVVGLATGALWLGRETFTDQATFWLQIASGMIVFVLGAWLMRRRWIVIKRQAAHIRHHEHHDHRHDHDHDHHDEEELDHALMSDDEHARAHAMTLPGYVHAGERPTALQIMAFGGAGGLIPCPASVTVMLLALSVGKMGFGVLTVLGFSLGLALTLVGIGMAIVAGLSRIKSTGRLAWATRQAPVISAGLVMFSGAAGVIISLFH
ncbi:nickel/cobalt efflux transporter RcnA [bacterium]|nr:nickel/cobalt efflux transporter RcnA [bacterium]